MRTIHVFIPVGLTVFLFACAIFAITLPSLKEYLMTSKSEMIKEITTSVWYLISDYNEKVQMGELTLTEAQELAKEQVR